jgi:hypothetical protein
MPVAHYQAYSRWIEKWLPHVLYGVHAVEAEQNRPSVTSDAAAIPGMQLAGGV